MSIESIIRKALNFKNQDFKQDISVDCHIIVKLSKRQFIQLLEMYAEGRITYRHVYTQVFFKHMGLMKRKIFDNLRHILIKFDKIICFNTWYIFLYVERGIL